MRGIRKPWPPSNVSCDGQQPQTLRQAEQGFIASLPQTTDPTKRARTAFDDLYKPKLREVMYREQGGLCVYCERRVSEGKPTPHIDHWHLLSEAPQHALDWDNLYLSCAEPTTCDCHKHEKPLRADPLGVDLPWPIHLAYERCVGFTNGGEAYVRTDAPIDDAQRRSLIRALGVPHDDTIGDNGILNLNHPKLVAARKAAIDSERTRLERDYKNQTVGRPEREARANQLLQEDPLKDFVSVRVQWLRRSLGKAK